MSEQSPPPCPRCSGRWIRDLLHQHRTSCPRYAAELGPREADHRRPWARAVRLPTDTELATIQELGYAPLGPGQSYRVGVESTPVWTRRVLIYDDGGNLQEIHPTTPNKENTND